MLFPTVTFASFFVVVFTAYWAAHRLPTLRKVVLLGASWVFYAWWDWRFVLLLIASIVVNHLIAGRVAGSTRWLAVGVLVNLTVLASFKYITFLVTTVVEWGWIPPRSLPGVLVPIGISFFTFEAISYQIELKRGVVEQMRLLDLATYMSFFPKLTSGPITRPSEFAPQLLTAPRADRIEATTALWLIARGLFKKVVLASYLAEAITTGVFAAPGEYSGVGILVGLYAYTAQIYLDFSAYTDMAIGLALLLGFKLPENFDRPYTRITVTQFWAHWHMTLTRWMRDFVYTPFLLRRPSGEGRTVLGLLLVMLLVGVWHGAGWTFIVFGLVHGLVMAAERLHRVARRRRGSQPISSGRFEKTIRWLITFHVVVLGWLFFGAPSMTRAFDMLGRLGAPGGLTGISPLVLVVIALVVAAQFVPGKVTGRLKAGFASLHPVAQAVVLGVFLLVVDTIGPQGVLPFIYFRF